MRNEKQSFGRRPTLLDGRSGDMIGPPRRFGFKDVKNDWQFICFMAMLGCGFALSAIGDGDNDFWTKSEICGQSECTLMKKMKEMEAEPRNRQEGSRREMNVKCEMVRCNFVELMNLVR